MIGALRSPGRSRSGLNGGQKKHQNTNDGNDHQKLDERKTTPPAENPKRVLITTSFALGAKSPCPPTDVAERKDREVKRYRLPLLRCSVSRLPVGRSYCGIFNKAPPWREPTDAE